MERSEGSVKTILDFTAEASKPDAEKMLSELVLSAELHD
jgi:hypothetical protein